MSTIQPYQHTMFAAPLPVGLRARNAGAATVLENAGPDWSEEIQGVIATIAGEVPGLPFTADDVRARAMGRGIPEPHHPNAYGAAMLAAARAGIIRATGGFRRSERAGARGRMLAEWKGAE